MQTRLLLAVGSSLLLPNLHMLVITGIILNSWGPQYAAKVCCSALYLVAIPSASWLLYSVVCS